MYGALHSALFSLVPPIFCIVHFRFFVNYHKILGKKQRKKTPVEIDIDFIFLNSTNPHHLRINNTETKVFSLSFKKLSLVSVAV